MPRDASFRSPVVVLGIMLKDGIPVTATMLEGMGARLEVVSISRTRPSGSGTIEPPA